MEDALTALAKLMREDAPLYTGATSVYPFKAQLEKKYRFTSKYGDDVPLCRVDAGDSGLIHLPRALCPVGIKD